MKTQKFPKTEFMMSDINDIPFYNYKPFKEDFKEEKSNDDSNVTFIYQSKYFRNEGKKKSEDDSDSISENQHNYKTINIEESQSPSDNESMIYITDLENEGIDNYEEDKKENEIEIKNDSENENNYNFSINSPISLSLSYDYTQNENNFKYILPDNKNKKIFKIVKVERYRDLAHKKRRGRGKYKSKKNDIDWENIITPKEKHFHLDRKKKRIVFQRKHLKMIYSIANLPYPFNFTELYKLIDEHVGDKTVNNYGNKKSYHIIKINGKTIITTMKEKKNLLGRKVKPKKSN